MQLSMTAHSTLQAATRCVGVTSEVLVVCMTWSTIVTTFLSHCQIATEELEGGVASQASKTGLWSCCPDLTLIERHLG